MNLRKSLKIALAQTGMSYAELAEKMDVKPSRLYNIKENSFTSTVESMAKALDMKVSEFIALGEDK